MRRAYDQLCVCAARRAAGAPVLSAKRERDLDDLRRAGGAWSQEHAPRARHPAGSGRGESRDRTRDHGTNYVVYEARRPTRKTQHTRIQRNSSFPRLALVLHGRREERVRCRAEERVGVDLMLPGVHGHPPAQHLHRIGAQVQSAQRGTSRGRRCPADRDCASEPPTGALLSLSPCRSSTPPAGRHNAVPQGTAVLTKQTKPSVPD